MAAASFNGAITLSSSSSSYHSMISNSKSKSPNFNNFLMINPSPNVSSPNIHPLVMKGSRRDTPNSVSSSKPWVNQNTGKPDPVYRNRLVNMMVNRILKNGKKSLAYHIIYRALKKIQQKTDTNPLIVLRDAIQGVTPDVTVKSRRVGGSTHQVPIEVGYAQGKALAIRWLLRASRKRPGKSMDVKLSRELMDAANGSGDAVRKKEETHKMAEANRAFAHFR